MCMAMIDLLDAAVLPFFRSLFPHLSGPVMQVYDTGVSCFGFKSRTCRVRSLIILVDGLPDLWCCWISSVTGPE